MNDLKQKLEDLAQQYRDGLITRKEYVRFVAAANAEREAQRKANIEFIFTPRPRHNREVGA